MIVSDIESINPVGSLARGNAYRVTLKPLKLDEATKV